ncbi:MAG: hypothetical protein LJE93_02395 [Acidobacteria bacterium]|jgi:hypothetical protein|nr:hypothetical protein [Acidobacteriota bacterium]
MTPDERDPTINRLFEGLETPEPPPHLRARVLAAARDTATGTPDVWSRIWHHRGLRLAWAATVVLLLAGHLLTLPGNGSGARPIDPNLMVENRPDEFLVEFLRPVRIAEDVHPMVGLLADAGDASDFEVKGNPS